jgi:chemotaxis protein methyltransferase CheR
VRPELRNLITFKQLNLLGDSWPISGQFDAIFCRNVMIYFDKATQSKILSRFVPLMKPDALLPAIRRTSCIPMRSSSRQDGL